MTDPSYTLTIHFTADNNTLAQQAAQGALAGTKDACPDDAVVAANLKDASGNDVPVQA